MSSLGRFTCVILLLATELMTSGVTAATCFGSATCPNGGTCAGADFCLCDVGYYSPLCDACRPIDHCPEVNCSTYYDNICIRCDGDFSAQFGFAYKKTDDERRCIKQCSWRIDSSACFPGSCTDASCTCSSGFTGTDCRTMDESQAPVISESRANLVMGTSTLELGGGQNSGTASLFNNLQGFSHVTVHWKSSYQPTGLPSPGALDADGLPVFPYIDRVGLGVVSAGVTADVHLADGGSYSIGMEECSEAGDADNPATVLVVCEYTFTIDYSAWTPASGDVLLYTVNSTSGGNMRLFDRDHSTNITRYYEGATASASANFTFDFEGPYHCLNVTDGCRTTMLDAGGDVTSQATITVTWQDWADDASGIGEYDLQVRQLSGAHGDEMTESYDGPAVFAGVADPGQNVTLPHTGVYSVILSVLDKASNARLSRRFVFFDDDPNDVTIHGTSPLRVLSATAEADYGWLTSRDPAGSPTSLRLDWQNHFSNTRHFNQGLLKPIGAYASGAIDEEYDQNFGIRGRAAVPNAIGVTQFRVFHDIDHAGGRTTVNASDDNSDNWSDEATGTRATFNLSLVDGDSIRFWVEARDIAGHSVRDSVLTHVDSSPPAIEVGDDLAVPSSDELDKMGVAFRTYDIHSGLRTIEWRIFDNQSDEEVELARQTLPPVKIDEETEDCDPASCLCIPAGDCYAVNYGFNPSLHIGGHSTDYFITLTVTNQARLVANKTIKVTVDLSPPEAGEVHDGMLGSSEVDYQEGNELFAHWNGFVDRQSGIMFYEFLFDDACWRDKSTIGIVKENMTRTTATHASWTAPSPGMYYITVIGYNSAEEPSDPVCSDGVRIDTSPPEIAQVVIGSARMWPGLAKDTDGGVWFVDAHRRRLELVNASVDCSSKATLLDDLSVYPEMTSSTSTLRGDEYCQTFEGIEEKFFLPVHKHLTISWNGNDPESSIFDYEIGLSSDPPNPTPDLVAFRSTSGHSRYVMYHPHVSQGSIFHLVVKATNLAQLSDVKVIGPIIVDTTPPTFTGSVLVQAADGYLIAEWAEGAFVDGQDTMLAYQVGIGHSNGGTETIPFQQEEKYKVGPCLSRSNCAAFSLDALGWYLHGDHEYYVSVRAANGAGLATVGTSSVYRHIVQLPSLGVVLDVAPQGEQIVGHVGMAKDINVQRDTTSISARWFGFEHPHLEIRYEIAFGSAGGSSDVSGGFLDVGIVTNYRLEGLDLTPLTTYYVTVRANSAAGSVNVTSDGVTVVQEGQMLEGCTVKDGLVCDQGEALLQPCEDDVGYQSSTSDTSARWTIPELLQPFVTNVLWGVEQEIQTTPDDGTTGSEWIVFLDYQDLGMASQHVQTGVGLSDGGRYRSKVQFCNVGVCFLPVVSDGFWVLSKPPEVGRIGVGDIIETVPGGTELRTSFQPFVHEYVWVDDQSQLMDFYEWRIEEDSKDGTKISLWMRIDDLTVAGGMAQFIASYDGQLDYDVCPRLSVRGFNKAGLSSVASTEIVDCDDVTLVTPHVVIDADHKVSLEQNAAWDEPDQSYTSSTTSLFAVWPTLRHRAYSWAAIQDVGTDQFGDLDDGLRYPCDHPMAKACGNTDKEFVNVWDLSLTHGDHYRICIHADKVVLHYETWNQTLPALSSCSDGIVVDTTPPTAGSVWIGLNQHQKFQRSTSELVIQWASFRDGEERGMSQSHSGIKYYEYTIGSFRGGSDVKEFTRIGRTESVIANGLILDHGHSYFATIRATDFVGLSAQATSDLVIIDALPPSVNANYTLDIGGSFIQSSTSVTAGWQNVFSDTESGIAYYEWAVGSHPGHADMMPFTRANSEIGVTDPSRPLTLQEGHSYFISVKAIDNVHLIALKSFGAFAVDASPPLAGHVLDGGPSANHRDRDYQEDRTSLGAFWQGFHDPHSALVGYSWKAGTCRGCGDAVTEQNVGLDTDVFAENLNLVPGLTYYVTVTACNAAHLCISATSDGVVVDDSPPVLGRVEDGSPGGGDISFQSSRLRISAHWWGFHDPHSGLSHYEWRAGTAPGGDDILPSTRVEKAEEALAFLPDADQMPVDTDVFVTVRALNRLGSWTEASSNGFRVDTSPPTVVDAPVVNRDVGITVRNTQVTLDLIRLSWAFDDPESGIKDQYISVATHRNGDINIPPIKVAGSERDHSFTNLTLDEGSHYFITVVACNFAGLCEEADAEPLLVDASPPSLGTFYSGTDQPDPDSSTDSPGVATTPPPHYHSSWMTWREDTATSTGTLALAWLGFADVHSGISHYFISVGHTYSGSELTPSGAVRVDHSNDSAMSLDEDFPQTAMIPLEGSIVDLVPPYLYITIWAINGVGLPSYRLHATFEASPTSPDEGALVLLQSCPASTCEGHCACAHRACTTTPGVCNDVTDVNSNSEIVVKDVLGPTLDEIDTFIDIDYISTQHMLAAAWVVTKHKGMSIKWYEWSVGDESSSSTEPAGVFDPARERIWFDVGGDTNTTIVFKDRKLTIGGLYFVFIRAWYDADTYAVFRSDGITPDVTPPKLSKMKGSQMKDLATADDTKDTDYLTDGNNVFVSWKRVFLDEAMSHYQVSISAYPGGEDVSRFEDHTFFTDNATAGFSDLSLENGQRYYGNVRAFNKAGLHTLRSSDGFVVDALPPHPGLVHDGVALHDVEYQSSSRLVSSSWHGFVDLESFIDHYEWCVGLTPDPLDDDLLPCTDVGMHLSASKSLAVPLIEGLRYYSKVLAVDAAGMRSTPISSDGFVVDITPPEPQERVLLGDNLILDPSFEGAGAVGSPPSPWTADPGSQVAVVSSGGHQAAQDGQAFLSLHGLISQTFATAAPGGHYLVVLFVGHAASSHDPLLTQEGRVQAPGLNRVFRLYDRPAGSQPDQDQMSSEWHEHRFYFTAGGDTSTLKVSSVGQSNGILLDMIQVRRITTGPSTGKGSVEVHTQFIHDWSSVQAKWHFVDPESPIVDYTWAIGTAQGGTQLQSFKSVGTRTDAGNADLSMAHGSLVHVTVTARNAADLVAVATSDPILIDLTAPIIHYVIDGGSNHDVDFSADDRSVSFSWSASDPESGIEYCEWAVGTEPGYDDVLASTQTTDSTSGVTENLPQAALPGQRLYATVTCYNHAKRSSRVTSDGVTIITEPPSVAAAVVKVTTVSQTQYEARDGYQSQRNSLQGAWDGFQDPSGVQYYECHLSGPSAFNIPWTKCGSSSETHLDWSGLALTDGAAYTLSVRAVNRAGLTSQAVGRNFAVESSKPSAGEASIITQSWAGDGTVDLGWDGLFSDPFSTLVYEVSLGSLPGGSDILQWVETMETGIRVSPLAPLTDYHLTVTAVNAAGLSQTVSAIINNG